MPADNGLLGLTDYEARVYRALLAEHPASAYRLGRRAGVPLSRVYEVANRLVEKGAATLVEQEPARYAPVPPDTLLAGVRGRLARDLDALAGELASLYDGAADGGHAWLRGEDAVLAHAGALAAGARTDVLLAAGPAAAARMDDVLDRVAAGVRTRALPLGDNGDAGFVLLADAAEVLVGRLGPQADALATRHPALVRLGAEFFRLRSIADAAQGMLAAGRPARAMPPQRPAGWLDWEEEKQRRLLRAH